jgi:hypothetical protein
MSVIHWVARGTGTPKDREEVNRPDVLAMTDIKEISLEGRLL